MSKVIIFSRVFPAYHPRKGERTYFIEKVLKSLKYGDDFELHPALFTGKASYDCNVFTDKSIPPKHHTIRAGNRWTVGDKFSPRIWSGKPRRSKQIIISPDIEVKKVWPVHFYGMTKYVGDSIVNDYELNEVALNDGLSFKDFKEWFNKFPFHGQIICWNENINY